MFGFKRKDPICGMKEEKGKGFEKYGKWFCNENCVKKYEAAIKESDKAAKKGSCCQ